MCQNVQSRFREGTKNISAKSTLNFPRNSTRICEIVRKISEIGLNYRWINFHTTSAFDVKIKNNAFLSFKISHFVWANIQSSVFLQISFQIYYTYLQTIIIFRRISVKWFFLNRDHISFLNRQKRIKRYKNKNRSGAKINLLRGNFSQETNGEEILIKKYLITFIFLLAVTHFPPRSGRFWVQFQTI